LRSISPKRDGLRTPSTKAILVPLKPFHAILRLCVLTLIAAGSALLLWSRNPVASQDEASSAAPKNGVQAPPGPASYAELLPTAKTSEEKACCDKPPTRAALMRGAPPANSP
jgi:hypothetical protein